MDFMEMREALNVAGCLAANGSDDFYGARPGAASLATTRAASVETVSRHAAPAVRIGHGTPIAQVSQRQTG